jgi:TPR repeat protein
MTALGEDKMTYEAALSTANATGDPLACNALGYAYYEGKGTKKDKKQALYWFQRSADKGNITGQYHVGLIYDVGKNYQKLSNLIGSI